MKNLNVTFVLFSKSEEESEEKYNVYFGTFLIFEAIEIGEGNLKEFENIIKPILQKLPVSFLEKNETNNWPELYEALENGNWGGK
jgi:hypothetical protein